MHSETVAVKRVDTRMRGDRYRELFSVPLDMKTRPVGQTD